LGKAFSYSNLGFLGIDLFYVNTYKKTSDLTPSQVDPLTSDPLTSLDLFYVNTYEKTSDLTPSL